MANQRSVAVGSLTATGAGTAADISDGEVAHLYVNGTFVATVQPEASADGTNYSPVGSPLTAPAIVSLPATAKKVRLNCTAFTSGTIAGQCGIEDADRLG